MKAYCTYLRVSTQKQGRSGLGLDAQRKMCDDFIKQHDGVATAEFVDVESGTHRDRAGLQRAIAYCKANGCALVIAKLDRLARDVEFCFKVVNTGIEIHFTDMPQMNTLLLGVFAAVAQYERELTSDRTKKALAVKREQGTKLGAANEKYQASRATKEQHIKKEEDMKRGFTKTRRYQQSRDVQALYRVLRHVFPQATTSEDPSQWDWASINTHYANRLAVLSLMREFKAMDTEGALFRRWDLSGDLTSTKLQVKLALFITHVKTSLKTMQERNANENV